MKRKLLSRPEARPVVTTAGLLVLCLMGAQLIRPSKRKVSRAGVYAVNIRQCLALAVLGFAADLLAIPAVLRNKPVIDKQELQELNRQDVGIFNQVALQQNALKKDAYKKRSDQLLQASIAGFATLLLEDSLRKTAWRLFVLYAFTHAVTYTFYTFSPLGPAFQNKCRPVVYYTSIAEEERSRGNNRNSFYSGHTSSAAAAAFFVAKIFSDAHLQLSFTKREVLYLTAAVPPLLVGYFRMKALKHFPSDVVMALALGALTGIGIPARFRIAR